MEGKEWKGGSNAVVSGTNVDASHTYTNAHTHIHKCTHTYTHAYTHIHTCTHTYTHAHTHTHTCTHTYTHAYTWLFSPELISDTDFAATTDFGC